MSLEVVILILSIPAAIIAVMQIIDRLKGR